MDEKVKKEVEDMQKTNKTVNKFSRERTKK